MQLGSVQPYKWQLQRGRGALRGAPCVLPEVFGSGRGSPALQQLHAEPGLHAGEAGGEHLSTGDGDGRDPVRRLGGKMPKGDAGAQQPLSEGGAGAGPVSQPSGTCPCPGCAPAAPESRGGDGVGTAVLPAQRQPRLLRSRQGVSALPGRVEAHSAYRKDLRQFQMRALECTVYLDCKQKANTLFFFLIAVSGDVGEVAQTLYLMRLNLCSVR